MRAHGQTMIMDARNKYTAGIIDFEVFKSLARGTEYDTQTEEELLIRINEIDKKSMNSTQTNDDPSIDNTQ